MKKPHNFCEASSAESKRFELLIPFRLYTLSRRAPSTTRTTLLKGRKNRNFLLDSEYFLGISGCPPRDLFHRCTLHFGELLHNIFEIAALITFAPERHGTQVGRIRFQHQVLQADVPDGVRQAGVFIGKHTADTQVETQVHDLPGSPGIPAETMEDTLQQPFLVLPDYPDALRHGLPRVNDDRDIIVQRPFDLAVKSIVLLSLKGPVPIKVQPDLP